MKDKIAILAFLFILAVNGQEIAPRFSFDFQDISLENALLQLQSESGKSMYLADEWIKGKTVTKHYTNVLLEDILSDLLKDTQLNFFISKDHRIIFTQNNRIFGELPENFFGREELINEENEDDDPAASIFLSDKASESKLKVATVRIGKEQKNNQRKRFRLSGTIRNIADNRPVPNFAVVVRALGIGTTTDNSGRYAINLPVGLNVVETSSLGFEDTKTNIIIYNDGNYNIEVEESYELLDEVVLKADAVSNVDDATTGNTKIGAEETKNIPLVLGERDLLKVATTLPGVTTAGEGSAGFNVRGGKTDQNLILLDNAVVYNPSHFFGIFQALNPFAISDLNIYKGAIPAEYGGRLSSVFEISTKNPDTEEFKGEVSIGPVTANAVVEIPLVKEKSGLMIGARGAYSDWVLRSLNDVSLKNSSASFYDVMGKYNHQINENNGLSVSGYYSKDAFSITSDSLYGYSNRLFSLKWDHKFNEKNAGSLVLTNSQYNFDIDFDGSVNDNFLQKYKIDETELKLRMKYLLNDRHNFDYGFSTKLYGVQPGQIDPKTSQDLILPLKIPKERGIESALFLTDNLKVNDKLLLDLGLRYSFFTALGSSQQLVYEDGLPKSTETVVDTLNFKKNEVIKTYGGPEVRISARYFLKEDFSIKASFNNMYQFIHTLSNNTTVSPIDTWKLSDYNIKPQQAKQFALGLYKNIDNDNYELSLEGFYKRQKNLLDFKTGAKLILNETIETEVLQGDGKSYGLEFFVRKNAGKLNGWLGYTYSRSLLKLDSGFREERVNDGRYFPSNFDKPHDFSLVLNYKFTKRYSVSTNFLYQTGRPVTFPVGNYTFNDIEYVLYSDRNRYRISDYYRLDIGLNIEGNHKAKKLAHSFWNISVYNVLGRNNPYSVFFVSDSGEIEALQSSIFSIPVPSITYNFKF
ncbi:carboxypeptidase-like regulatory domain-containing protein [Maribacter sp. HTCC2170]|uniref:TonB-dependent receptor n=1 Tax=Maribacter sp. (strain HTCC2170 / KCCM 42371) TaxID=313603 RepID=UPI00006BD226|nr:carboxypeptidase-like regulatory domain-containing protein [Maribacter sp. HTCC2170]EAR03016.1 putative TonB-dependent outer membrane receptor protein [Maribacter sp. HTCC2170]